MRTFTLSSSSQPDKSFRIALSAVLIFAAAEVFSASFYYIGRIRPSRSIGKPAIAPVTVPVAAPSAPPVALAVISPAPAITPPPSGPSASDRLLKEALALRDRGDTTTALARLQEASEQDPKNAKVLEELAKTYESMQLFDRSNETWRKIQEIGPSAGASYEMADSRLKLGVPIPSTAAAEPGLASASLETAAPRKDVEGIPAKSMLGISDITASETPDADTETNLMLRVSVKKRPDAVIDHTRVKIQVFFYDTVGESTQPVLTNAEVSYEWLTPNHDWADTNPEILAITYLRPKSKVTSSEAALSAAAAAVTPGKKARPAKRPDSTAGTDASSGEGLRRYLGYIVRVYYNDKLQDIRANPAKLLKVFPPSATP
jgi:tetratricopeptide (TPR) repeat protein